MSKNSRCSDNQEMCRGKTSFKKLIGMSRTSTCQTMTDWATGRCAGLLLAWLPGLQPSLASTAHAACSILQPCSARQRRLTLPSLNFMWALIYNCDMAEHCAAKDALPQNTEFPTIHWTSSNHATLVERVHCIKSVKGGTLEQNLHTILPRFVTRF